MSKSLKIFAALLATETNTFAPIPTGWGAWRDGGVFYGDASRRSPKGLGLYMARLRALLEQGGHELVESVSAFAQPLGRTVGEVYESLRDAILADLVAAGPVNGVVLLLHGAMVADGCDDCEGDLIAAVRRVVGPTVPIGVELDLHCHYTRQMHASADVIVAYKEYPHTDMFARMKELVDIVIASAHGHVKPVCAVYDCHMLGLWHTTEEPMAGFVRKMKDVERQPGVLSVSLGHGFPWGDVRESGAKVWVVTDGQPDLAQALAEMLARDFWAIRDRTTAATVSARAALAHAYRAEGGLTVAADVADNPGGGAMGDSTFMLQTMVDDHVTDAALGVLWDPGAVQVCRAAGVGARLALRIGGKCGRASGDPVDLQVTVKAIEDELFQQGMSSPDERVPFGAAAWVRTDQGIDIVLASVREQTLSPTAFTSLGIDLTSKRLVVVKSSQHFRAQFSALAQSILYVTTRGTLDMDVAALPYRVRQKDYWPYIEDPHGWSES